MLAVALSACEREPLDVPCPAVAPGDLAISEVHEQYVEVFNATAEPVDLAGAAVVLQSIMGGDPDRILVRDRGVVVAPGGYAVLGRTDDAYVDYVYAVDFDDELYDNAQIRLEACGVEIDAVVVRGLPGDGSLAFDGARDPSAADNDDADPAATGSSWCVDTTGGLGSPGTRNPPCP
ncbi:MAG: lamin tail domain-containing protein [Deltaproteobacteria bacterium]|nr:MAG: lamin tail domain-containing protein [Deltaproteobacteria bacterium]